jgi:hypothetical protein
MSLYGLQRGFYGYLGDNGTLYQVAITVDDANAGGFSAVTYGANPSLPRGWKMRHCYGVNGALRTKTPVASPAETLYTDGGTFTKGPSSTSFTVQGIIGEKRTAKS